jgi:hypothetical protein
LWKKHGRERIETVDGEKGEERAIVLFPDLSLIPIDRYRRGEKESKEEYDSV